VTLLVVLFGVIGCLVLAAVFAGSEIGLYSLSRTRVEADARRGERTAKLILALLRYEALMLTTLLVANNAVTQAATVLTHYAIAPLGVPPNFEELVVTLCVAPPIVLFGEIFPKDLFRRRPHALVGICAPLIVLIRALLAPVTLPLVALTTAMSSAFGFDRRELARVRGREAVIDLLSERETELLPHVEKMARNALELRSLRVERVMVPWRRVEVLRADVDADSARAQLAASPFARLPVVDARGAVRGYLHQLEVLGDAARRPPLELSRPMIAVEPDTPLDRALARLRAAGQRAAIVGTPAKPLGLVTLKDLIEEISGELARW
jgi:CBS domain containing-hemolysin-like protein